MRKPTPVTTQSITAVRESKKQPAVALKEPASIQVYQSTTMLRDLPSCQKPIMPQRREMDMMALMATPIQMGQ